MKAGNLTEVANLTASGLNVVSGSLMQGSVPVSLNTHTHSVADPELSTVTGALGADEAIASGNTYVDGPEAALTEGLWLVTATVTVLPNSTQQSITAKLWDGTTVAASTQGAGAGTACESLSLSGLFNVPTTATAKVSVATSSTGYTIKAAAPANAAGNTASSITAVRVGASS
jgi:hypothetical protein